MAYPTDVTDAQWALLEPVLGRGSRGPRPVLGRRTVLNAILYQARTGCQWRYLAGPIAREHGVNVEIKHRERLPGEFKPIKPLWRVEDAFAELGRWRRLARSFEATPASATAWVQVACVGWMLTMV
jgi:transposase